MNIRKINKIVIIVLVIILIVEGIKYKDIDILMRAAVWIYVYLLQDKVEVLENKLKGEKYETSKTN